MTLPPEIRIDPGHPLIILQTSDRFEDHAEHGREIARAWREAVPDDIKPYCQLQAEIRIRDHETRYDAFRRIFDETGRAGIPVSFQFADPHDIYVFDPVYVEKLVQEYPCIKSLGITEMRFEHYSTFNVPRYAIPPETRYAIDILKLGAQYGKHVSMSFQSLKWMHIGVDALNEPLVDTIRELGEYCLPQNEHIGPQHLPRQTSVWGFWIAGLVRNWGIEPQSWWFENGRMLSPGLFGQDPDNTRLMPPLLYRAMILEGIKMGATVFQFEPFWDLFDYDNSVCWREVIYPTLKQAIQERLIPTREQVMEKTQVAYHLRSARNINEFHENLRDVDWIHDEGLLARAAYGVWERFLEHELSPNKGRYYYIPLLPPKTPPEVLNHFERVITPGLCASEAEYEALLNQYYQGDGEGTACIMSMNGHVYVMQTHENLYERQSYAIDLPKPVRGLKARRTGAGVELEWDEDPGAEEYRVYRSPHPPVPCQPHPPAPLSPHPPAPLSPHPPAPSPAGRGGAETLLLGAAHSAAFMDTSLPMGAGAFYTVTAKTSTRERREGTVNYLDYMIFSLEESLPAEWVEIAPDGELQVHPIPEPPDTRPASQVVFPTFEGAEGKHLRVARWIVTRIEQLKAAYEEMDWRKMTGFYSADYQDSNGFHREYVGRAWKWWFMRNNSTCMLRQIRRWDFSDYGRSGEVRVRMFSLFRALRRDDQPFGYGWSGTLRIPRTADEEVTWIWIKEKDKVWRVLHTDPAVPNLAEILWNSRGCDKTELRLVPGVDE